MRRYLLDGFVTIALQFFYNKYSKKIFKVTYFYSILLSIKFSFEQKFDDKFSSQIFNFIY